MLSFSEIKSEYTDCASVLFSTARSCAACTEVRAEMRWEIAPVQSGKMNVQSELTQKTSRYNLRRAEAEMNRIKRGDRRHFVILQGASQSDQGDYRPQSSELDAGLRTPENPSASLDQQHHENSPRSARDPCNKLAARRHNPIGRLWPARPFEGAA
jgi:hypothetical protein